MSQEPPSPLNAAAGIIPPQDSDSNSLVKKTTLTILEGIVLGVLAFAFGNYYVQLSKSTEVRWTSEAIECLDPPACSVGRLRINVYKLGGAPAENARFLYAVSEPETHQFVGASVQKYEVSLLNGLFSPSKDKVIGTFASLPNDDPETNPRTAFDFDVDELEPGQVYELIIILHSNGAVVGNRGRFEVRKDGKEIAYSNLRVRDNLRLYFVEGIVFGAILFVVAGFVTVGATWGGRRFFARFLRLPRFRKNLGG